MGRRTWIKIYCEKWLQGSLRDEPAEVRGVWIDLLCLAGDSTYGDEGVIKITPVVGFTDETLAEIFLISLERWKEIKNLLIKNKMIKVQGKNIIEIVNWKNYQSEYLRQKPYRLAKKEDKTDEL